MLILSFIYTRQFSAESIDRLRGLRLAGQACSNGLRTRKPSPLDPSLRKIMLFKDMDPTGAIDAFDIISA